MIKTKSLERIEQKMENVEKDSLRYQVLEQAKKFKTSWIELGQALYSVHKDRLYKEWGYLTFEAYIAKEVGIKKQTGVKLLKSYYFLEKEEPNYVKKDYVESAKPSAIPNFEAVNLLRLAKNKKTLTEGDYSSLKKNVFEYGKDFSEIKKDLSAIIKQREEASPEEAREKKRSAALRRFLTTLKTLKRDLEISKLLSAATLKQADNLISKIEEEIGQ